MKINKTNYGIWFLDYYEELLAAEQVAELFLFLEQHPELRDEFEMFTQVKIVPDTIVFENRESLKKSVVSSSNIDHYLIGEIENDLNLIDKTRLKEFISKNPQ